MIPAQRTFKLDAIDLSFRSALKKLDRAGRLLKVESEVDADLEAASIMARYNGELAVFISKLKGYDIPYCANLFSNQDNVLAIFESDVQGVRELMERALYSPMEPVLLAKGACQEVDYVGPVDLVELFPVLKHTELDGGRYITGGIVAAKDPQSGARNISFHRLQIIRPDALAIKLDIGRHLRAIFEKSKAMGRPVPVAVVIGADVSAMYAATAMGSQAPYGMDEYRIASALQGFPLELVKCETVGLEVPAASEVVLEGEISESEEVDEGPFIDFIGLYTPMARMPVLHVKKVYSRGNPIFHGIGGLEPPLMRKHMLEVGLLEAIRRSVPIVRDVELTAGGLYRFHIIISVRKEKPQDEGYQRNAVMAAFTALKDLDLVVVVDDDIDIRNWHDVEWAIATRFEASRGTLIWPGARGHEYIPASNEGVRAKLGIDATLPAGEVRGKSRARAKQVDMSKYAVSSAPGAGAKLHSVFR